MDDIIKAYDRVKKVILAISLNNSENLEESNMNDEDQEKRASSPTERESLLSKCYDVKFQIFKNDVPSVDSFKRSQSDNSTKENEGKSGKIKENEKEESYYLMYSKRSFRCLTKGYQKLVEEAENKPEKQIEVGKLIIERKEWFSRKNQCQFEIYISKITASLLPKITMQNERIMMTNYYIF